MIYGNANKYKTLRTLETIQYVITHHADVHEYLVSVYLGGVHDKSFFYIYIYITHKPPFLCLNLVRYVLIKL